MDQGTPKSLNEAIANGILGSQPTIQSIEEHVRDYLSQHFSVSMLTAYKSENTEQAIRDLWKAITGKEIR